MAGIIGVLCTHVRCIRTRSKRHCNPIASDVVIVPRRFADINLFISRTIQNGSQTKRRACRILTIGRNLITALRRCRLRLIVDFTCSGSVVDVHTLSRLDDGIAYNSSGCFITLTQSNLRPVIARVSRRNIRIYSISLRIGVAVLGRLEIIDRRISLNFVGIGDPYIGAYARSGLSVSGQRGRVDGQCCSVILIGVLRKITISVRVRADDRNDVCSIPCTSLTGKAVLMGHSD